MVLFSNYVGNQHEDNIYLKMNNRKAEDYKKISKSLSFHLRHGLRKLSSPTDGYIKVYEIIRVTKATLEEIEYVVNSNEKQRFTLTTKDGLLYIRANQGHTKNIIDPNEMLEEIKIPLDYYVHGTYQKNLNSILENGLNKMSRDHIHFASNPNPIS